MKKILAIIISILTIFCTASCDEGEKLDNIESRLAELEKEHTTNQYKEVELTTANFYQYIAFNFYISDCIAIESRREDYKTYNLSYVGHIETSKKQDCHFKNVFITFNQDITATEGWDMDGPWGTYLDWDGNSHISFSANRQDSFFVDFYAGGVSSFSLGVKTITGRVLIPC